jgi:proline iminopeptidase
MIFMDHRGYAPPPGSPVDATAFTEDKLLDDIERARQQLGLGRIVIIGHSIHSVMALEYAKKYPDSVSHVVMIGSPALNAENERLMDQNWEELASPERKAAMEENRRRFPDEELAQLPPGQRFLRTYLRNGPRTWFDPHFDASPLWEGVEANDVSMQVPFFRDVDITQGLDTFDRPVFLALGRYDFLVAPPSAWASITPRFRDLTTRVFERSGHWPHYEEPEVFDSELLGWLKDHQ